MAMIDTFLRAARERGGSDLHLTAGLPPILRVDGELVPLDETGLSAEETHTILSEILPPEAVTELEQKGAVDLSYAAEGSGRFRLNVFREQKGLAALCRLIPERVPALAELGLPRVVSQFAGLHSGLVLITGGPGTGKTTTLAGLIHEINANRSVTVITLEDPVEFRHECQKALVIQREVGTQVHSFHDGLRSALRQDPDVILIGEMRDPETIAAAIEASETGHLVLGTLHTRGAAQTIHRIVDAFPSESQAQIRHTLADNLKAVVSQELVRAADGRGRRAVTEILIMTPAVAQLVREGKNHQIPTAIATGRRLGMQLLDQTLLALVQSGDVDPNDAFLKALDKKEFMHYVTQPDLLAMVDPGSAAGGAQAA